jgi:cupin 2 domain-containing protein
VPQASRTTVSNLLTDLSAPDTGEDFQTLLRRGGVHIERIFSSPRPEPTRYDQAHDEWVLLLQGQATLDVAGESVRLGPGDHLLIPAHCPHRVLSTSDTPRCVWLAVHIHAAQPTPATPPAPPLIP